MYRVIFESVNPRDRRKVVERGPWLVNLQAAMEWKSFLAPHLPYQKIWIESADALGIRMTEAMS
ncbi:hypothetical protein IMCC9480_3120 [Oxalobacteraceae bacterium IMCC9480]|nr:hypothetical protein IMCC9480_3120 [Oxalobacteraceae bacterium IMCC9480]